MSILLFRGGRMRCLQVGQDPTTYTAEGELDLGVADLVFEVPDFLRNLRCSRKSVLAVVFVADPAEFTVEPVVFGDQVTAYADRD